MDGGDLAAERLLLLGAGPGRFGGVPDGRPCPGPAAASAAGPVWLPARSATCFLGQDAKTSAGSGAEEPASPPPQPGSSDRESITDRLKIPAELQRFGGKPIELPKDPAERKEYLNRLYPPLPPLGPNLGPLPGLGSPLALADLQNLAMTNSPLLRQPAADVEAAKAPPSPRALTRTRTSVTSGTRPAPEAPPAIKGSSSNK